MKFVELARKVSTEMGVRDRLIAHDYNNGWCGLGLMDGEKHRHAILLKDSTTEAEIEAELKELLTLINI